MTVRLPTGQYTVRRYGTVEDSMGTPSRSVSPTDTITVTGRVRENADGILLALDPEAWPIAEVPDGVPDPVYVTITGPKYKDGPNGAWVIQRSSFRKGNTANLDTLSYVEGYASRLE